MFLRFIMPVYLISIEQGLIKSVSGYINVSLIPLITLENAVFSSSVRIDEVFSLLTCRQR